MENISSFRVKFLKQPFEKGLRGLHERDSHLISLSNANRLPLRSRLLGRATQHGVLPSTLSGTTFLIILSFNRRAIVTRVQMFVAGKQLDSLTPFRFYSSGLE